ncbi:hypothetical protein BIW11_07052 [Tropilaelaps mercedesae]|uniref:Uncharacterized protein n=1 Tax=Tropilaelaps mercedesae TaxID=418985 RepID=A0A1V9XVI1_9ACAR|nr:hypothetical protein BIW11_07052 [Tropilaelaps mercedesae]
MYEETLGVRKMFLEKNIWDAGTYTECAEQETTFAMDVAFAYYRLHIIVIVFAAFSILRDAMARLNPKMKMKCQRKQRCLVKERSTSNRLVYSNASYVPISNQPPKQ